MPRKRGSPCTGISDIQSNRGGDDVIHFSIARLLATAVMVAHMREVDKMDGGKDDD